MSLSYLGLEDFMAKALIGLMKECVSQRQMERLSKRAKDNETDVDETEGTEMH